jgi:hypothetical protein
MSDFFDRVERELVGALEREREAPATTTVTQRAARPRRPRAASVGLAGAIVAAGLAVATFVPGGSGLVSPQQAVADVGDAVDVGVLHWRSHFEGPDGADTSLDLWMDLSTRTWRQLRTDLPSDSLVTARKTNAWYTGRETFYLMPGADRGTPTHIVRVPATGDPGGEPTATPIDSLIDALERAQRGEATIAQADLDGVPAALVSDTRRGRIVKLWIERDSTGRSPRLLKSEITSWSCDAGDPCDHPSNDVGTAVRVTDEWTIEPRDDGALAEVQPPDFGDSSKYRVTTERLPIPPTP